MTTDQTDPRPERPAAEPLALWLNDQLGPRLVACPMCGADKGYTLSEGSTYRWWRMNCADCGRDVDECRSDNRARLGGILPDRCESADHAWNEAGAYAQKLRDALLPLANAHSPIERECLTDGDWRRAQEALYGPNAELRGRPARGGPAPTQG